MICTAIAALNEPDGSSKQAISRYIERIYTGIPPAHNALLSHHLKSLKNNGILMMVRKSYKFAATPPPTSVALASAATATALEPPRSDFLVNENQPLPDPVASSTPLTQKRGRGRPPKPKPDVVVQTNGKPTWEQNELPRPPGRPRKDGALPTVKASVPGGVDSVSGGGETVKRRGRPPSGRAAGRERKPTVVSAPVSVIPYVANGGVRRRGRPKRVDAESGGEVVAVVKRRGRGRPPKIGGIIRKPMKPKRSFSRTGKPLGRPRKSPVLRQQDGGYVELKKKFELFQARAKDIVVVLKAEIGGTENQAVVRAIQSLEELTVEEPQRPQHMVEEVQADDEHPETGPEPEGQGGQQGQAQTEAEAMQEALF
ncbi:unnamed protein product [Arabis nemorensis]|uniref:H15 domain-containing protein n=1 Tax=Arabis nemorensis TaxID=586526 RepID=A0A565BHN5_9BRAS|nr:unnamed protein product [Arabis nemorensis]